MEGDGGPWVRPAFLNTHVRFLNDFDILYDADQGSAGYWLRHSVAAGFPVTPTASLKDIEADNTARNWIENAPEHVGACLNCRLVDPAELTKAGAVVPPRPYLLRTERFPALRQR